jgi:sterol-4alpha-carboxylate 3-dehydrogenase (decarboxylating)
MNGDIMTTDDNLEMYNEHTPKVIMYQKSKGTADIFTLAANSVKLRTVSLRVPGLYGEDDPYFIREVLEQLKKGQHKFQVDDNKTIRDDLYIDNCVLAHILAAEPPPIQTLSDLAYRQGVAPFVTKKGVSKPRE